MTASSATPTFSGFPEANPNQGVLLTLIQRLSGLKAGMIWDCEQESILGSWGSLPKDFRDAQTYLDQGSLRLMGQGTLKNRQIISLLLRLWQTEQSTVPAADYWYKHYRREYDRRRQAEQENETLLRELHHRVKNNLQLICSLLRLQSYRFSDPEVMAGFEDMQNRIQAMASLHERLYRSGSTRSIGMKTYIAGLVSTIEQLYHDQIKRQDLRIEVEISLMELSADLAISCGLIIHELVTNALKHAFPIESAMVLPQPHRIQIQMAEVSSTIVIGVCDNGVGLPPNYEFETTGSIGLQLVFDLVDQLHGSIALNRDHGTSFEICIPRV